MVDQAQGKIFWDAPALANAGFAVFPIAPGEKNPSVDGGFYAGTRDVSQIAAWLTEGRDHHNIGVATGVAGGSNLVVIEADDEAAFEWMRERYGPPTVESAHKHKGGGHWYFRHPGDGKVISRVVENIPVTLHRKGDGGYVLAPPSTGKVWTNHLPNKADLPPLPRELRGPKKREASATPRPERNNGGLDERAREAAIEAIARHVRTIKQGRRHEHLMHLCGVLLSRDVAPEDAEALLIDAWSQADAELADRAPQEVPNTLSTTAAALENEHATGVPQMERITPGLFEELERIFRWRLGVHSPNGRKLLLEDSPVPSSNNNEIKWFYELGDPKPREFLIADACVKGYPVVCYGAGGTAKSFAVLAAGVAIASASGCDEWLGIKVLEHGYALYLDFELDVEEQHRRVRDLCNGLGVPIPKRLAYLSAVGLTTEEAMAKARAFIQKYNAVAIILDSMGLAMGGDMDKAKDVIKFYRQYVDPLRNLGATPFIVDHEGKLQPGERHKDKAPIGSAYKGWLGRSLFQFLLEEYDKDNSTMKIRVRQHKTNFTPIRPFGVEFHFEAEKVSMTSYDLTDQALADEDIIPGKQRILGVLEVEDATRAEIVTATGLSDATVRGYLAELRREGKIGDKGYRGRELVYTLLEDGPKETDNNKEEF